VIYSGEPLCLLPPGSFMFERILVIFPIQVRNENVLEEFNFDTIDITHVLRILATQYNSTS